MHEIGLIDDMLSAIEGKLKKSKEDSRIKRVNILIGELEHVIPEDLEFHFRERTKGTPLEKAELSFKKVKARFRCKNCRLEFSIEEALNGCPDCKASINDVIKGKGISIESIEVY